MKFYVLQSEPQAANPVKRFDLFKLRAKDPEEARRKIKEEIAGDTSQEWLLNEAELKALRKVLKCPT